MERDEKGGREQLRPTFSVIHATRGRREQAMRARSDYVTKARRPRDLEYLLVVDAGDPDLPWFLERERETEPFSVVVAGPPAGCNRAFNEGAAFASGRVLVVAADDVIPPEGWDELVLERLGDVKKERVLATSDGHRTDRLVAHPILTAKRFERQGRVIFDESVGVYADADFTEAAYRDGVVVEARDVVFEHAHPSFGRAPSDETYARATATVSMAESFRRFKAKHPGSTIR